MKYVWKFEVVNRPSKEKDGVTNASQDFTLKGTVAGEVIAVGSITKSRGSASYVAKDLDDKSVGEYETRSQAAHALRKHRVANAAKATETVVETKPEVTETVPVVDTEPEVTESEPVVETEPEVTETVTIETDDVAETTAEDLAGEAA